MLAAWQSAVGLIEFLLSPTMGRLSDAFGLCPFMLLSPAAAALLKLNVARSPSVWSLFLEKLLCDALRTLSGTTMCSVCLSDLDEGSQLARSFANLWSAMGMGVLLGPLVASSVVSFTGKARHAF